MAHPGGRRVAAPPAQYVGAADSDARPGERPHHVDPVAREISADECRPERARGIHRHATDRRRPQAGERDVSADGERSDWVAPRSWTMM